MTNGNPHDRAASVAAALDRARAFASGVAAETPDDALARLRVAVALGDAPVAALRAALPAPSSPASALRVLALLAEARALGAPEAAPAVRALEQAQGADGGWAPDPVSAPDEQPRLVLSGIAAGLLARTDCARPAPLRRAGAWLASRWGPERVQDGDFGRIAGYACWLANANPELADAGLQWCGREWERAFRSGRMGALQAARVLVLADAPTLPGARLGADEIVLSLLAAQGPDGGWPTGAGRLEATAEAVVALRHLGGRR